MPVGGRSPGEGAPGEGDAFLSLVTGRTPRPRLLGMLSHQLGLWAWHGCSEHLA